MYRRGFLEMAVAAIGSSAVAGGGANNFPVWNIVGRMERTQGILANARRMRELAITHKSRLSSVNIRKIIDHAKRYEALFPEIQEDFSRALAMSNRLPMGSTSKDVRGDNEEFWERVRRLEMRMQRRSHEEKAMKEAIIRGISPQTAELLMCMGEYRAMIDALLCGKYPGRCEM